MFSCILDDDTELRLFEVRHAPELRSLTDQNRDALREWLPWIDHSRTIEDTRSFIWRCLQQFANNDGIQAGIWYRAQLAGVVGNHGIDWTHRKTDLGYWLGSDFQGKGLMTKACSALMDHAFAELGLNRVEIRAATGNTKSRAIPERLGFTQEGVIREAEWLYDHFVDNVLYGLLASEWHR